MDKNNLIEISLSDLKNQKESVVGAKLAVWRKNAEGNLVIIPFEKIEQFFGEEANDQMKLYLENNWQQKIEQHLLGDSGSTHKEEFSIREQLEEFGDVNKKLSHFKDLSIEAREEILDQNIESLSEMQSQKKSIDLTTITEMIKVVANTFYINHANFEDNISSPNLKDNLQGIYVKTNWVVKILIDMTSNNITSNEDLQVISKIETGSYTMDHMSRVLLEFISFCRFYNDYIDDGKYKKIRVEFSEKYEIFYKKKLGLSTITTEVVFQNGLRRIDTAEELPLFGVGALLYDIGKVIDINYHDGDAEFEKNIVHKHVLNGYNMIIKSKFYPFAIALMAAFHHEYYGNKDSYNFTNALLSKYTHKKLSEDKVRYFISYDENNFINREALSFFPCKMLEILDVYDALVFKRQKDTIEALKIMKKEFIAKQLKIDPVLFRIFLEYKLSCGYITQDQLTIIDSIKF